jgi:hypothetical protein
MPQVEEVHTIFGTFDRRRATALRAALDPQTDPAAVFDFEGHPLLVKFARYLLEMVEHTLGVRH